MAKRDPAVKKETAYIAVWVLSLSLVMEAVFLLLGKWEMPVLWGNLIGAAAAIGNHFLLGMTVARALETGEKDRAMLKVRSSMTLRMLGIAAVCAVAVGVLKTNVFATLIPLLFPGIGLKLRPLVDKKQGRESAAPEGSDLLD